MINITDQLKEHINNKIRSMVEHHLEDIRKLEGLSGAQVPLRWYLSGRLSAFEEMENFLKDL